MTGAVVHIAIKDATKIPPKPDGKDWEWGEIVDAALIDPKTKGQRVKVYACHEGQLDVLQSTAKFTGAFAGAQGGKTACAPLWCKKQIDRVLRLRPKGEAPRGLIISPSVPMRKQSQITDHLERYFEGTIYAGRYLKEGVYRFTNKRYGEILFRTADNPASLDGGVYDFIVVDEAAKKEYTAECWERIKVRASARNAPVLVVSTPDMASPIYDEFISQTKALDAEGKFRKSVDGEYFFRRWESLDRPGFNAKAVENAKKTMTPTMFDRMYRGVFTRFEGLIYECFGDDKAIEYPVYRGADGKFADIEALPSPALSLPCGQDFGFTIDPACHLFGAFCEDGKLYVLDELYKTGLNNDHLAAEILKIQKRWTVSDSFKFAGLLDNPTPVVYCDREDPKAIATLRNYGINARRYPSDMKPDNSIHVVVAMFKAGRIVISARCKNLIDEATRYAWKQTRAGDYIEEPSDRDNHAMDALRYMVASFMWGKQITPLDLSAKLSDEEQAANDLEAAKRLNLLENEAEAEQRLKEKADAERNKRLHEIIWYDPND